MTRKRGRPLSARPARPDPETFDKLRALHERFARMTGPPANAFAVGDVVGLAADLAEKAASPGFTLVENDRLAVAVNAAFDAAIVSAWKMRNAGMEMAQAKEKPRRGRTPRPQDGMGQGAWRSSSASGTRSVRGPAVQTRKHRISRPG